MRLFRGAFGKLLKSGQRIKIFCRHNERIYCRYTYCDETMTTVLGFESLARHTELLSLEDRESTMSGSKSAINDKLMTHL